MTPVKTAALRKAICQGVPETVGEESQLHWSSTGKRRGTLIIKN